MNKKTKQIIKYVLALIFVFIAPILLFNYFRLDNIETFYERLREDNEICYQRAKRDGVDTRWCSEIRDAAKLAYSESTSASNVLLLVLFFAPLIFVLIITVGNLRTQVEELKEKLDV